MLADMLSWVLERRSFPRAALALKWRAGTALASRATQACLPHFSPVYFTAFLLNPKYGAKSQRVVIWGLLATISARMNMKAEEVFEVIFWTLFASMFAMRFWFAFRVWRTGEQLRADDAAHEPMGFWARITDWLFLLLLAAIVVHLTLLGGDLRRFAFSAPNWLRWAGCALGVISVGLFAWAHAILGRFWSPHLLLRRGHQLITRGPYAGIRHPIYSAIVGWLMSLGLVTANWTPFVLAAVGLLHFLLKIRGEEKMMLEQFGEEYRVYRQGTGRLLPACRKHEAPLI